MNRQILLLAAAALGWVVGSGLAQSACAAERVEEATVVGKDKSSQAGRLPSDTRAVQAESKMKKEEAPTGLNSQAPGVRTKEKMEKPRMAEPERKKPEAKKGWGNVPMWMWIILLGGIAAAAG